MAEKPIIKVDKLNVIYFMGRPNQVNAVTDVNLEIYPGEFIIFFGPSGCGKSTLLYSIAGLERNIQGDIYINGGNLAKFGDKELNNHRQHTIGMIFQAYYLISSLSVLNNIILPQFSLSTKKAEREKKAVELLEFFGVSKQKEKFPNELSGGQQQRVAICRSLINDPSLILADEPTGNLDSKSATDVMNLLLELNEKKGKTVVLVTHSPGSLDYAHRVFHMKDGKLIDTTVNRKRGEPVSKELLEANVLAKDLETAISPDKEKKQPAAGGEGENQAGGMSFGPGDMLTNIKAREIVMEALTGLSLDEVNKMERLVERMIAGSVKGSGKDLFKYLDNDEFGRGLGFDSRTAKNLTARIKQVVKELNHLQEETQQARRQMSHDLDPQVTSVRHYIFDQFDIRLARHQALVNFDNIVKDRLNNLIDQREVEVLLALALADGGAGFNRRLARKAAKRLELLTLGKI